MGNVTYCVSPNHNALIVISPDSNEVHRTVLKTLARGDIASATGFHRHQVVMPDKTNLGVVIPLCKNSSMIADAIGEEIVHRLTNTPDLLPEYELIIRRHLDQASHV